MILPKPASPKPAAPKRPRKTPPMTRTEVRAFLEALHAAYPDAASELNYTDPFTLLCAVVMSAQTTDAAVNRVGVTLFAAAPTPAAMAALGADGIAAHIRSLGLWQAKSKNVAALSQILVEKYEGNVPDTREDLESLPGVGRKTANVVLNVAFEQATMAVDTHVFRLGNRTGIAPGKDVRTVEDALVRRIPPDMLRPAHHWLILHGRYVCKARTPECWRCIAATSCRYPAKTPAPQPKRTRNSNDLPPISDA